MSAKNIYQRMNAVMAAVQSIEKDKETKGAEAFRYKYVSGERVLETIRPHLIEQGIVVIPSVIATKNESVLVKRKNGESTELRTEMDVRLEFVNMDDPKDRVETIFLGVGIDPGDKGPGKALAYAHKYGLLKTFCIPTSEAENDADNTIEGQRMRQSRPPAKPLNPKPIIQPLDPTRYRIMDEEADRIAVAIQSCRAVTEAGAGRAIADIEFRNRAVEFAVKSYCETHNKMLEAPNKAPLMFSFFLENIERRPQDFASKLGEYIHTHNGAGKPQPAEREAVNA